eukprot:7674509-Pyramimonas_sp.AAC.1
MRVASVGMWRITRSASCNLRGGLAPVGRLRALSITRRVVEPKVEAEGAATARKGPFSLSCAFSIYRVVPVVCVFAGVRARVPVSVHGAADMRAGRRQTGKLRLLPLPLLL